MIDTFNKKLAVSPRGKIETIERKILVNYLVNLIDLYTYHFELEVRIDISISDRCK